MSKLAKKPVLITEGVEVKQIDGVLEFSGKEGKLSIRVLPYVDVDIKDKNIFFKLEKTVKQGRANLGTMASLVKNAIAGVGGGFAKILVLEGIGFRASMDGANLVLNVGFSHPVKYVSPAGVKIVVEKNTIKITGPSKELVGQVAA
ncbi:MAG: 50S ribosomal protein L6, partial [Candidatus Harrisonbacteria bacterium]|nr:50S ribosomal protein L6 [Candidatus Harrisonbacteria bacterium]